MTKEVRGDLEGERKKSLFPFCSTKRLIGWSTEVALGRANFNDAEHTDSLRRPVLKSTMMKLLTYS